MIKTWVSNGFRAAWHLTLLLSRPRYRVRHGAQFITLTEGGSFERSFNAYKTTAIGQALLSECPSTQNTLFDRAFLAASPHDSLAFQYWRLIDDQGLSEELYLAEVNAAGGLTSDPQRNWYRMRVGVMHDLRHLLTGYNTDPMGEFCLIVFRFAQMRHMGLPALMFIMYLAALKRRRTCPIIKSVLEAYQRGKAAKCLDLVDWELERHRPLAWHRAKLNITPLRYYQPGLAPDLYMSGLAEDGPACPAQPDSLAA